MNPIDGPALLALWEAGLAQPALRRGDALIEAAGRDAAGSLGARNRRLADLHRDWFGRSIALVSRCAACGTVVEFVADCDALSASTDDDLVPLRHGDHEIAFRLPRQADVIAAAGDGEEQAGDDELAFARRLLSACVTSCRRGGIDLDAATLPDDVLDALSRRLEALDPDAAVSFDVRCPQCAAAWDAALDLERVVWMRVRGAAERLLLDVDLLARRYGWTEGDVLSLATTRRAAYVQLATA